jgi:hypothetical protein
MTLLVLAVLLAGVCGFLVIHPILARRAALVQDVTSGGVLDAEARKRVALTELKEIEYDFLGGKLDEADYRELRDRLSRAALVAIQAAQAASDAAPAAEVEHSCGFVNPAASRFCAGCGARLA